jgi:hypothetical protein
MQADKSTSRTLTAPRKPQRGLWGYVKKTTFKKKEAAEPRVTRWTKQSTSDRTHRFSFTQDLTRKNRFESAIIEYLTEEKMSLTDTIVAPKA